MLACSKKVILMMRVQAVRLAPGEILEHQKTRVARRLRQEQLRKMSFISRFREVHPTIFRVLEGGGLLALAVVFVAIVGQQ